MTEVTNEVVESEEATVEVDGVKYKLSELSAEVQDLLKMHQSWSAELAVQGDKVNQIRAAVQHVANQVVETIRSENAPVEAEGKAPAGPAV